VEAAVRGSKIRDRLRERIAYLQAALHALAVGATAIAAAGVDVAGDRRVRAARDDGADRGVAGRAGDERARISFAVRGSLAPVYAWRRHLRTAWGVRG
jgi:hypothetical protein